MFRINVGGVQLGISFSFPAVLALVLLTGCDSRSMLTALICCFLHECGHLLFMIIFGNRPQAVTLYGGGIRITPQAGRIDSLGKDLTVLLAGCGMNFLLALTGLVLDGMSLFVQINLLLGAFNLLPFRHFDGGRALELLTDGRGLRAVRCTFILLTAMLIVLMGINGSISISLLMTFVFALAAEFAEG
ncbi:peptidase M50 [Ruminococcus albus]|uniref:Peptidase M50 n=1 Tax=Ruminococcus albus (strain ATCC 27210 / DSM 20455 / JCM 14654 / NCDO 2250 / 7) TaxID=697329 RepID=E6UF44_RUMA7|nr:peptidase M50 [Ruminococcus albus]ADU23571.1 peptidase M50 [Ruminococcus albus 7 = DSM 20455]